MKRFLFIALLTMSACGGTLTEEQKRKIKEEMEHSKIKRLSDADIMEASFAYGRALTTILEKRDASLTDKTLLDSLRKAYSVEIISMKPGDSFSNKIEQQIIEAYVAGSGSFAPTDNIQKLGQDSILYTKPFTRERPDGSFEFSKAIGIRIPKKQVILSIKN